MQKMNMFKRIKDELEGRLAVRRAVALAIGVVTLILVWLLNYPYTLPQLSDDMLIVAAQSFERGELIWKERYGYDPGEGEFDPHRYHYYALQSGSYLFCYVFPEDMRQGDTVLYLLFQKILNRYSLKTTTPVSQDKLQIPIAEEFAEEGIKIYLGPKGIELYNENGELKASSTLLDQVLILHE